MEECIVGMGCDIGNFFITHDKGFKQIETEIIVSEKDYDLWLVLS